MQKVLFAADQFKARYTQKTPQEVLRERSKKLKKSIYALDESMKTAFPSKPVTDVTEDEIEYCQKLIAVIEQDGRFTGLPKVSRTVKCAERNAR